MIFFKTTHNQTFSGISISPHKDILRIYLVFTTTDPTMYIQYFVTKSAEFAPNKSTHQTAQSSMCYICATHAEANAARRCYAWAFYIVIRSHTLLCRNHKTSILCTHTTNQQQVVGLTTDEPKSAAEQQIIADVAPDVCRVLSTRAFFALKSACAVSRSESPNHNHNA